MTRSAERHHHGRLSRKDSGGREREEGFMTILHRDKREPKTSGHHRVGQFVKI